jgi:23S rRNA pseudouridine2457 synthase
MRLDSQKKYVLFHKPYGVICQFTPELPGDRTLADFHFPKGIYPMGRLDKDSEGLLLLTDDGGFIHEHLEPKFAKEKTYWVQIEGEITPVALEKLEQGPLVKGEKCLPLKAKILEGEPHPLWPRIPPIRARKSIPTQWLELTLSEGKNRQVRRMTAAVGYPTLRLIRKSIGPYQLTPDLGPGVWIFLTE